MTTVNTRRLGLFSFLALFCMLATWVTVILWICAFNAGTGQSERVKIFQSYFPSFSGLAVITITELILCIGAGIISGICLKLKKTEWRILNIFIIVGCELRLFLILFSFM
ncbi:MAG: hypothetical protein V4506_18530 [Bacteroidota bacterium]